MRIQETNEILNEARVARKAHQHEIGEFNRGRMSGVMKSLRSRGVQAGILGGLAAIGLGVFLLNRRRNGQLSFDFR